MNALIIANLHSGKGRAGRILSDVVSALKEHKYRVATYITTDKKSTVGFLTRNATRADLILVLGGDGTLNEVVNGYILSGSTVPIGYIPTGSTNDFAATFHLERDARKAVEQILSGNPSPLDLGRFSCADSDSAPTSFCYVAAAGAFSETSYATSSKLKHAFGHLAYVFEGVRSVPKIKPMKLDVIVDGVEYPGEYLVCTVSNSTSVAGVFHLDSKLVSFNDGLLEVALVKAPPHHGEYPVLFGDLLAGNYDSKYVRIISGKEISVRSKRPIPWSLDGEYGGNTTDAQICVLHERMILAR